MTPKTQTLGRKGDKKNSKYLDYKGKYTNERSEENCKGPSISKSHSS